MSVVTIHVRRSLESFILFKCKGVLKPKNLRVVLSLLCLQIPLRASEWKIGKIL